jgi:hypothetical protein
LKSGLPSAVRGKLSCALTITGIAMANGNKATTNLIMVFIASSTGNIFLTSLLSNK